LDEKAVIESFLVPGSTFPEQGTYSAFSYHRYVWRRGDCDDEPRESVVMID
jgi:hypothetical protein